MRLTKKLGSRHVVAGLAAVSLVVVACEAPGEVDETVETEPDDAADVDDAGDVEPDEESDEDDEAATDAVDDPPVDLTTWMSYDVGASGYVQASHLGDSLMNNHDLTVRIIPASGAIERHAPVQTGDADVAFTGVDAWFMQEGIMEYAEMSWGPQPVRTLWFSQPGALTLAVRGDSDIMEPADLEGQRVPRYPGAEAQEMYIEAVLAFAGLSYDDVEEIESPGYTDAQEMVMNDQLDVALIATEAPQAYEWDSLDGGIRYLETPHDDSEGWDRMNEVFPPYGPYVAEQGAGIDEPLELGTASSPQMMVYDDLDHDVAYFLAQSIHEGYEDFAAAGEEMERYWTMERNLELYEGSATPFHEGVVSYLEDAGIWDDDLDAENQERVERQTQLADEWEEAIDEATSEGISEADFPELWMERREAAGL